MKWRLPTTGGRKRRADEPEAEDRRPDPPATRDAAERRALSGSGGGPGVPASTGSRSEPAAPLHLEAVRDALRTVIDPEVGLDIVTMGLVYDLAVEGSAVHITFTLTTPGCPLADVIRDAVEAAVSGVPGVEAVEAELVWEPAWNPGMIEEGAW
jgi:metal-sulfur cluster biosynthetic enzyme